MVFIQTCTLSSNIPLEVDHHNKQREQFVPMSLIQQHSDPVSLIWEQSDRAISPKWQQSVPVSSLKRRTASLKRHRSVPMSLIRQQSLYSISLTRQRSVPLPDKFEVLHETHTIVHAVHNDDDNDERATCVATSHTSSSSSCSKEEQSIPISLMEERLLNTGLLTRDDLDFVPDYVSKDVLHLIDEETRLLRGANDEENVSHVKTGIWEVVIFEDDGSPKDTYYVVTGVSMDDHLDTKKLRKHLFAGKTYSRRPKITLAPTDIAEDLTGYQSGTMAPICHGKNMKLYLEESLLQGVDDTEKHRVNVGSGIYGKCLSISWKHFLLIAEANPSGLEICPIIQRRKK